MLLTVRWLPMRWCWLGASGIRGYLYIDTRDSSGTQFSKHFAFIPPLLHWQQQNHDMHSWGDAVDVRVSFPVIMIIFWRQVLNLMSCSLRPGRFSLWVLHSSAMFAIVVMGPDSSVAHETDGSSSGGYRAHRHHGPPVPLMGCQQFATLYLKLEASCVPSDTGCPIKKPCI